MELTPEHLQDLGREVASWAAALPKTLFWKKTAGLTQ